MAWCGLCYLAGIGDDFYDMGTKDTNGGGTGGMEGRLNEMEGQVEDAKVAGCP
jgi:hypothetical protein